MGVSTETRYLDVEGIMDQNGGDSGIIDRLLAGASSVADGDDTEVPPASEGPTVVAVAAAPAERGVYAADQMPAPKKIDQPPPAVNERVEAVASGQSEGTPISETLDEVAEDTVLSRPFPFGLIGFIVFFGFVVGAITPAGSFEGLAEKAGAAARSLQNLPIEAQMAFGVGGLLALATIMMAFSALRPQK